LKTAVGPQLSSRTEGPLKSTVSLRMASLHFSGAK